MQNFQAKFEGYLTLHYRPAQLYTNKLGWYIEYATLTDDQKSFRRKRIKLNRLRKKCQTMMDFRTKAESIVTTINNQLQMHICASASSVAGYACHAVYSTSATIAICTSRATTGRASSRAYAYCKRGKQAYHAHVDIPIYHV